MRLWLRGSPNRREEMPKERDPLPGALSYIEKEYEAIAQRLSELNGFFAYSVEQLQWDAMRPETRISWMRKHECVQRSLRSLRNTDV